MTVNESLRIDSPEDINKQPMIQKIGNDQGNELALDMVFNDSVIQKALNVLEYFNITSRRITIQEISSVFGLSKATAHRIITELKNRGYVSQQSDKSYFATLKMMMVGTQARDGTYLMEALLPYLTYYAQKYNCSAGFSVFGKLNSNFHVYSVNFDPALQLPIFLPGKVHPMHCTGSGKVKLAAMSDDRIENWLNSDYRLLPYTSKTIIDRDAILEEIERTRQRGYAISNGEYNEFVGCVSVPLSDVAGRILGSMNFSVPIARLDEINRKEIVDEIISRNRNIPVSR